MSAPTIARRDLLAALANDVLSRRSGHPLRVAVDGPTAAGKTTLADELGELLGRSAPVIRAGLDGFHRPRALRYARGRRSATGYYEDARDYAAVRKELLDPLGPGGSRRFRRAIFDLDADVAIDAPQEDAEPDAILIVDGTFLQRDEFAGAWDIVVFLDVDPATSLKRGVARDASVLGGHEAAAALYHERYLAAWALYAVVRPADSADLVIDHRNPEAPRFIKGPDK